MRKKESSALEKLSILVFHPSLMTGATVFLVNQFLFTGKKTVITFHEVWGRLWFKLPFMNRFALFLHYCFEQFLLRLPFNRFIAVSESTASRLLEEGVKPEDLFLDEDHLSVVGSETVAEILAEFIQQESLITDVRVK